MKKFLPAIFIALTFVSCIEMKIHTRTQFVKNDAIKKIGVFEVMIGKPIQAFLPIIDAASFNGKMDKISNQIIETQAKKVTFFRESLAFNLKNTLQCEIIFGKELQKLNGYEELRKNLEYKQALETKNDYYPLVLMADGEFNIFPFEKGHINDYLNSKIDYSNLTTEVCEKLGLDGIVINFSELNVKGVTSLGFSSNCRLDTHVYIFDKLGKKIGHGIAQSKKINIKGKEIIDYKILLDEYNVIIEPLVKQLLNPVKK